MSARTLLAGGLLGLMLLAIWSSSNAQVAEGQEIISLPGTGSVHELTLNTQVATTVTFPTDITLVTGYGMVLDAGKAQALIESEKSAGVMSRDMAVQPVTIVHYAQASGDTLILRAVRRGTPCFLTVRCGTQIFLFKLVAGEQANLAVVMQDPAAQKVPVREVKKQEIINSRTVYSSAELVGILSKARQRAFLETVNPSLYEGWQQRTGLALSSQHGDLTTTITEVQQCSAKDAIVLRCRLASKSTKEVRFKPSDVKVRVGDRAYSVQLADSSGVVSPGKTTLLDVVMQGNESGGKEHLALQNDFRIEVAEDLSPPPPNDPVSTPPVPLFPTVESKSSGPPPQIFYEPGKTLMPEDPVDRRAPLPNLYLGK